MLWRSKDFQLSLKPYGDRSRGILTLLDTNVFVVEYSYNLNNTLIISGIFMTHIHHYDLQKNIFLWQRLYEKVVGNSRPT